MAASATEPANNAGKKTQAEAPATPATPSKPTQYVILQALVLPGSTAGLKDQLPPGLHQDTEGNITLWLPLRSERVGQGKDGDVRIVESANGKETAIKLATKMDESDAQRPGTYKAVPLQSWRGGKRYKNRETVITETEDVED